MKISTKGRYALKIMLDLALHENRENYISLRDISIRQGISNKYLEQIVSKLNKAGYVKAARGNNGGYKLTKKPEEYRVGDILRATEGSLAPIMCVTDDMQCDRQAECLTYSFWEGLDKVINDYVDSKTLADLIK